MGSLQEPQLRGQNWGRARLGEERLPRGGDTTLEREDLLSAYISPLIAHPLFCSGIISWIVKCGKCCGGDLLCTRHTYFLLGSSAFLKCCGCLGGGIMVECWPSECGQSRYTLVVALIPKEHFGMLSELCFLGVLPALIKPRESWGLEMSLQIDRVLYVWAWNMPRPTCVDCMYKTHIRLRFHMNTGT